MDPNTPTPNPAPSIPANESPQPPAEPPVKAQNIKGVLMVLSLVLIVVIIGGIWYTKVSQPQTIDSDASMRKITRPVVTQPQPSNTPSVADSTEEAEIQNLDIGDTNSDFSDLNNELQVL